MCGIGGFVDFERDARRGGPILHGMKRTLTPRGPDAEGTYFDEDAALVHRRLIVIDPEGGKNILVSEIGRPIEISENSARLGNSVPAGRLLVDGLGIGDVGTAVLRDRKHLSEDGLLVIVVTVDATTGVVIAGPDIVSRGFVYVKEAEALMEELRTISQMALDRCSVENLRDWNSLKSAIKGDVSDYLFKKTKRSPMVLPIIMEI